VNIPGWTPSQEGQEGRYCPGEFRIHRRDAENAEKTATI
jgi:hypothetical protein